MARLTESAEVREEIVRALGLDLIGPWAGHPLVDERLPGWVRPSNWYLTGFLVPRGAPAEQRGDADVDDEPEVAENAGLGDDSAEDRRAAKKGFFPSSMGLSFLVGTDVDSLEVVVRWGDYRRVEAEGDGSDEDRREVAREAATADNPPGEGREESGGDARGAGQGAGEEPGADDRSARSWWQRTPREEPVAVALLRRTREARVHIPVPNSRGLALHVVARPVNTASFAGRIPPGTRSVSLFLVNGRNGIVRPGAGRSPSRFRPKSRFEARRRSSRVPTLARSPVKTGTSASRTCTTPTPPSTRPDTAFPRTGSWWTAPAGSFGPPGRPPPTSRRRRPSTCRERSSTCSALGALADGSAAEAALSPLVAGYRSWIDERRAGLGGLAGDRLEAAHEILAPRGGRRSPDGARHPRPGERLGRARRLPHREPCRRRGALAPPRTRRRFHSRHPTGGPFSSPSSS